MCTSCVPWPAMHECDAMTSMCIVPSCRRLTRIAVSQGIIALGISHRQSKRNDAALYAACVVDTPVRHPLSAAGETRRIPFLTLLDSSAS